MQNSPEFEKDHPQVQYVKVAIPYKRVFLFLAIAVALQSAAAAVGVYLYNNERFIDVCTSVAMFVFITGSFMWGKFPGADQPMTDHMVVRSHLDAEIEGRTTSLSSQIRGVLVMLSGVLFALCSVAINWLLQSYIAAT